MFSFFEKLLNPFPDPSAAPPPNRLFAFCRYHTRGAEAYLLIMALLSAIIAIAEIFLFSMLGSLVDRLGTTTPATLWSDLGGMLAIVGALLLVGIPLIVTLHSMLIHQTMLGNYPMAIRWRAHRYLLGQSVNYFDDEFSGRIATRVMQTALAVRETVMKLLDVAVYISVYFFSMIVLMGSLDWRLAIPMIVWLAAYIGLMIYFLPKLKAISSRQAHARAEMTGRIVDTYTNIHTVKLFSHSARESAYAREGMDQFLQTVHPQMRLATLLNASVWTINALLIFSLGATALLLWTHLAITTGAIATALALVLRINGMSQWIMWEVSSLFENIGTAQDGANTLSKTISVTDTENASPLNVSRGEIAFDQVNFSYDNEQAVMNNFSLTIAPGEKVGLVGRSGAGKSTLVNLLLRFYDVDSGVIRVDGQDISQVSQETLRQHIGMVTQDTSLLHRSIRDNLLYGKPGATEEDMLAAAQQAEAHEFILTLQDAEGRRGYDAHVGERGVKLSGGQRQRIAIARVLLKNAPLLILDEATSALDSEVEAVIQSNLKKLMDNKTVIAIAHRLSTIAALDRLIVLDKGRIVEQGTHRQLLDQGGLYAELWAHQSGGFLGEE